MRFIDRQTELDRLEGLSAGAQGALAVVYGRRRVGKTRLLVEWLRTGSGLYTVADQSSSDIQRSYFAGEVSRVLSGFSDVRYPDWATLLRRLATDAQNAGWRGPLAIDELPYLVQSAPELPSVLQRWLDHEALPSGLTVMLAGSSQRMMQGLVLDASAPLYGRARECMKLQPLAPWHIAKALGTDDPIKIVAFYAAWGGIPRYWELALAQPEPLADAVDRLVLDPLGPLHREPERLLIEELPPATEVRPVLDAIGQGAHRACEIATRSGHKATSLSKPLVRLQEMDLVVREVPFGASERSSKTSLYRIADPFLRMWFKMVAPHRSYLAMASPDDRSALFHRLWPEHAAACLEALCRTCLARLKSDLGPWQPAGRWWRGNAPEWDVVAEGATERVLLLGECKWRSRPFDRRAASQAVQTLKTKPPPTLSRRFDGHRMVKALFVPAVEDDLPRQIDGVTVLNVSDLLT